MSRKRPFELPAGEVLAKKFEVIAPLGSGWEGEVYRVREQGTNIERAAKLFYPESNVRNRTATNYAKRLHALRDCSVVIPYHSQDTVILRGDSVTVLVSEYVEGELLEDHLERQPGQKLSLFQGIHLLHALAAGLESIHLAGEYHGDFHTGNIIVRRFGLSYDLKFLDFYHHGGSSRLNRNEDLCNAIRIFYDAIGGARHYRDHPEEIRKICCGLKRTLMTKRFRSATVLRRYLETQAWNG